jgi:hypothetical protein
LENARHLTEKHVAFVGYRKAFGRVDGRKRFNTRADVETTNQKILACYKCYTNNSISVKILNMQITARHGSPLSPVVLLPASSDTGD